MSSLSALTSTMPGLPRSYFRFVFVLIKHCDKNKPHYAMYPQKKKKSNKYVCDEMIGKEIDLPAVTI